MSSTRKTETGTGPDPVAVVQPPAGRASESGDPAVHQLLAQRQTAMLNEDVDQLADTDRQLVLLGFVEYEH